MAIFQATCISFKKELYTGTHDFTPGTGDTFKLALYDSTANLSESTTVYTTSGEITDAGYTTGGYALTTVAPTSVGNTALVDFADLTIPATVTARGALIYNASKSNKAVCVINFGLDRSSSGGNFVITFPAADAQNAILRMT